MELDNIETVKKLIKKRDCIMESLDALESLSKGSVKPIRITFVYPSGYERQIDLPSGDFEAALCLLKQGHIEDLKSLEKQIEKM